MGGVVVIPLILQIDTDFPGLFQTPDMTLTCQMAPNASWLIYSASFDLDTIYLAAKQCLQK